MVIDYNTINTIFNNYINFLNQLKIFKFDANKIYENKDSIIDSILTNLERKNNLSGITNGFILPRLNLTILLDLNQYSIMLDNYIVLLNHPNILKKDLKQYIKD